MKKQYKQKEVQALEALFQQARQITQDTVLKNNIRDSGSSVLGNGIKLLVVPPRCRNAVEMTIVRGPFQGNLSNHEALKPALEFLKAQGVDCFYCDGNMD